MTNLQLLLSIGIPSFLVALGILLNQKSNADLGKRLDSMETRMDRIEARISIIEHDLRQFYSVTGRLEGQVESLLRK